MTPVSILSDPDGKVLLLDNANIKENGNKKINKGNDGKCCEIF